MDYTTKQFERLPKWAQARIEHLQKEVDVWRNRATVGPEDRRYLLAERAQGENSAWGDSDYRVSPRNVARQQKQVAGWLRSPVNERWASAGDHYRRRKNPRASPSIQLVLRREIRTMTPPKETPKCYCGHAERTHINKQGLCLAKNCFCLIFRHDRYANHKGGRRAAS